MSGLNFKLYQARPETDIGYVQLQVGKGKKKQPSVYIESDTFDCVIGVIWNKHREFGNQKTINKINNDDWRRILIGFEEAIIDLNGCTTPDQLIHILSLPNHLYSQKDIIFEHKKELQTFIKDLIQWIETHLKKKNTF